MTPSLKDRLFVLLQQLLPQQTLSRLAGWLARSESPWIRHLFIGFFLRRYHIDLSEAEIGNPADYHNFNHFFTRALKPGARQFDTTPDTILCPADGSINQIGPIRGSDLLQAKGQTFSLYQLLGGDAALASQFMNGHFATIYLAPSDYHRVHMPLTGTLRDSIYIPGKLFSVNGAAARHIRGVFARNERLVCLFDSERGPFAVILVGAMIVAGIETVFAGQVVPTPRHIQRIQWSGPVRLEKGAELGRFLLGSTVIVLLPEGYGQWQDSLKQDAGVRVGEVLGHIRRID